MLRRFFDPIEHHVEQGAERGILLDALAQEKVITERPPWRLTAADGSRVVIFEWVSPQGARRAQDNPTINERMSELELVAEQVPLADLEEADELDASFASAQRS